MFLNECASLFNRTLLFKASYVTETEVNIFHLCHVHASLVLMCANTCKRVFSNVIVLLKYMRYIESICLFMFMEKRVIKSSDEPFDDGSEI